MVNLWEAARNDQSDVLKSLLEGGGVWINEKDYNHFDSDSDRNHGVEFDSADYIAYGKNALHHAASARSFDCIQVLMDAGANVFITADQNSTALHLAAGSSSVRGRRCMEMLLHAGLSLDEKNDDDWNVLHFAAYSGHPKTVEHLLQEGFDPSAEDTSGRRPTQLAKINKNWGAWRVFENCHPFNFFLDFVMLVGDKE